MGSIVPFKGNSLPDFLIASDADNSEFSHGAGEGFGVLSYRGKVWRLKHKGEEHVLTKDGEPTQRLNLVMIRANKGYSKIYYAKKYAEGDDAAPDCFSPDGVKPDPSVQRPQCKTCEACPMNVWGSRMTDEGKKAKACQDSRRMAVLLMDPKLDISTEEPVLLRIPPASLTELKTYADGMSRAGVALYKIITQVSFDTDASFPKLLFKAFGWDESQADTWSALRESDTVKRILDASEVPDTAASTTAQPVHDAVVDAEEEDEDEEVPPPSKPASKAKETPPSTKPAKAASTKSAPKVKAVAPPADDDDDDDGEVTDVDEDDADALVSKLLAGDDD